MDYREGYNYYDKKEKEYDKKENDKKEKECECKKEKEYEEYPERKEELHIPCHEGGKVCFPPCTICGNEEIEATVKESARVLNVKVKLKKVCGNKKVCIGVLVFEKGGHRRSAADRGAGDHRLQAGRARGDSAGRHWILRHGPLRRDPVQQSCT